MQKELVIAVTESDRTAAILSGQSQMTDFHLKPYKTSVEEIFKRQVSEAFFDIAELSLASYLVGLGRGEQRLTAIPVFLSRAFRHNAIYVRADSPWTHPSELRGCRFGLPEFQMTAAVWVRALLRHEWDVPTDQIQWVTFRPERIPVSVPVAEGKSENIFAALANGEVDAIMSARRPPEEFFPLTGDSGAIRRLIPDVWNQEREYFRRTGIFPIMHLVSLKQEIVREHPSLPKALFELFSECKTSSIYNLMETVKLGSTVPWLWEAQEDAMKVMNLNIWPYGVRENWSQIEQFMSYLVEDGLLEKPLAKEQIFEHSILNT